MADTYKTEAEWTKDAAAWLVVADIAAGTRIEKDAHAAAAACLQAAALNAPAARRTVFEAVVRAWSAAASLRANLERASTQLDGEAAALAHRCLEAAPTA